VEIFLDTYVFAIRVITLDALTQDTYFLERIKKTWRIVGIRGADIVAAQNYH